MKNAATEERRDVVGLVPAAGVASRLAPLPCSKEVYPVGFQGTDSNGRARPKVASQYLLEAMRHAGVQQAYVILREGKWDLPAYWGDGHALNLHLAYLMMRHPYGTSFTLDQAYPFVRDKRVVLGFPDVLFQPRDAFARLLAEQHRTGADVVLGLFPARRPEKVDMVQLDEAGHVRTLVIKPEQTALQHTWIIAAWAPSFTAFLHAEVERLLTSDGHQALMQREVHVGHVIQRALDEDLDVRAVRFPEGTYADIGTPDQLVNTIQAEIQAYNKKQITE